jgi:hypothetical protein
MREEPVAEDRHEPSFKICLGHKPALMSPASVISDDRADIVRGVICRAKVSWLLSAVEEEAHHFATGVGATRFGVRSGRAATRPSMAPAMQDPLLQQGSTGLIRLGRAGEAYPAWRDSLADFGLKTSRGFRLRNDLVAVDGIDRAVAISVEYDCWHDTFASMAHYGRCRAALTHSCESGWYVACRAAGQSGMNPNPCIEIRIGDPQDSSRGASRG